MDGNGGDENIPEVAMEPRDDQSTICAKSGVTVSNGGMDQEAEGVGVNGMRTPISSSDASTSSNDGSRNEGSIFGWLSSYFSVS